ncbi:MAG: CNP1-like family protein [Betaproteobacteria bacterium]
MTNKTATPNFTIALLLRACLCCLFLSSFSISSSASLFGSDSNDPLQDEAQDLPSLPPKNTDLVEFQPFPSSSLDFYLDRKSLKVIQKVLIKFTVVIKNSSGTSQTLYTGIDCNQFTYRLYGSLQSDGSWKTIESDWKRIPNQGYNQYQAYLSRNGMCTGETANTNFNQIMESIR